ncbi:endonuclease/exonuclease/phosphatase family protein [Thermopolyspora sp. NPDC052614]|uniref:endonuclease/exonuclease/phosphatase family protein n=1 Tax=Thermopolyspora sp. NPDC052614 TaxID=3155682 RepID=UPI00342DEE84
MPIAVSQSSEDSNQPSEQGPLVRIMSWNIQKFAIPEGRWPGLVRLITQEKPDILCLQETHRWDHNGYALAKQAAEDLGMEVRVGRTANTAIAYRPKPGLSLEGFDAGRVKEVSRGYSAGRFAVADLPAPLVVISAHVSPYSVQQGLIDVQPLVTRARRHGGLGLIAGDFNHPPLDDPPPDFAALQPHLRMIRGVPEDPLCPWEGPWRPNTRVAEQLLAGEMVDAAAFIADRDGRPELRAPTGVYGQMRVDRFEAVLALRRALKSYNRIDPKCHSDHYGIVLELDLHPKNIDWHLLGEFH